MSSLIQTSLSAGELSERLFGRVDLNKYRAGLSVCRNFFVDYRGGVSTRAGTRFMGFARQLTDGVPILLPFIFSSTQTYSLELTEGFMRILSSNGGYVLNPSLGISAATNAAVGVFTIPANTYAVGNPVTFENISGFVRPNGINGLNGRTLFVRTVAGASVTFKDIHGTALDTSTWTAFAAGGSASFYEIAAPWDADALFALKYAQSADVMTVTHPDYPVYEIKRFDTTDWRITPAVFGSRMPSPTGVDIAAVNNPGGTDPQFLYIYALTAYNADSGEESSPAIIGVVNAALNQNTGCCNQLTWDFIAGNNYRIYAAQRVPNGVQNTTGPWTFGFIGNAASPPWSDINIDPDYSVVPPTNANPFQSGNFTDAVITAAGFGYLDPIVDITDITGVGAAISITHNAAGAITSAVVVAPGFNYTAPVVTVREQTTAPGSGATMAFSGAWAPFVGGFVPSTGAITISAPGSGYHVPIIDIVPTGGSGLMVPGQAIGLITAGAITSLDIIQPPFVDNHTGVTLNFTVTDTLPGDVILASRGQIRAVLSGQINPSVVGFFDQRRVFAASRAFPDTMNLSKPGLYNNFDTSFPSQANDAIESTIVGQEVNAITSLTPMPSGLIALTSRGAYQVSGGTPGAALTPLTIQATAQAFSGASSLSPLRAGYDLLYVQARGSAVRDLAYNFYANVFTGQDVSALSEHLLRKRIVTQWAWAEEPYKLVWAVRDDGLLLSLTYVKEQEVYGWARHDTNGQFRSVCVLPESGVDAAYFVVRRPIEFGQFFYTVERMDDRYYGDNLPANIPPVAEQAWCVDCGVAYEPIPPPVDAVLFLASIQPPNQIISVDVIEGGTGYTNGTQIAVSDASGPGRDCFGTINVSSGVITSVTISTPGQDYVEPVITVPGGSGAIFAPQVKNQAFFTTDTGFLNDDYIGYILRCIGGRGRVVQVPSAQQILVDIIVPFTGLIADAVDAAMMPLLSTEWTLTPEVSVVGGLDHLTGTVVAILADGSVQEPQLVVDGCITIDPPASYIIAGMGFTAQGRSLRADAGTPTIQGKRKNISAVTLRATESRGLAVGPDFYTLSEFIPDVPQFNTPIALTVGGGLEGVVGDAGVDAPIPFFSQDMRVVCGSDWDTSGVVCFQQSYPLPATVLAIIPELQVGDT